MTKWKRRILCAALAGCMVLAGCGAESASTQQESTANVTTTTAEPNEIPAETTTATTPTETTAEETTTEPKEPPVQETSAEDFDYTEENGEITITKYKGSGEKVAIPAAIDGKPVTVIGEAAFYYCRSLTSITLPDGVIEIGALAFSCCDLITSLTIPDSVTEIGDGAFSWCQSLTSITLPDGLESLGKDALERCDCDVTYKGRIYSPALYDDLYKAVNGEE